jgi:hypothetical protein
MFIQFLKQERCNTPSIHKAATTIGQQGLYIRPLQADIGERCQRKILRTPLQVDGILCVNSGSMYSRRKVWSVVKKCVQRHTLKFAEMQKYVDDNLYRRGHKKMVLKGEKMNQRMISLHYQCLHHLRISCKRLYRHSEDRTSSRASPTSQTAVSQLSSEHSSSLRTNQRLLVSISDKYFRSLSIKRCSTLCAYKCWQSRIAMPRRQRLQ